MQKDKKTFTLQKSKQKVIRKKMYLSYLAETKKNIIICQKQNV
jgi:hypothetical protein